MKKTALLCFFCLLMCVCVSCARQTDMSAPVVSAPPTISAGTTLPENRTVRLSVAEMLGDSGLLDMLKTQFESQSVYRLEIIANPNNTAVSVAATGKAEILIAQPNTVVTQFISAGYGKMYPFLSDSFVLLGPPDDPAAVRQTDTVLQGLYAVAKAGSPFVSRYDDSDAYYDEAALWKKAGIAIGNGHKWYIPARLGADASLRLADAERAYILTEKEAYLREKENLSLTLYYDTQPELMHTYSLIKVSADAFGSINTDGTAAFIRWLSLDATKERIRNYGMDIYGSAVFEPDESYITE